MLFPGWNLWGTILTAAWRGYWVLPERLARPMRPKDRLIADVERYLREVKAR